MAATPQEIYQRYLRATLTQNADAVAEMFTVDGVFQAPLVPAGQAFPRHLDLTFNLLADVPWCSPW